MSCFGLPWELVCGTVCKALFFWLMSDFLYPKYDHTTEGPPVDKFFFILFVLGRLGLVLFRIAERDFLCLAPECMFVVTPDCAANIKRELNDVKTAAAAALQLEI